MDTLLASYGMDQHTLQPFLRRESVLLAGSAALALYLEQEGIVAGFEPADLDIWVSGMDRDTEDELVTALRQMGYAVTAVAKESDVYMERLTRIQQVLTLESDISISHQKKIQVIRLAVEDVKAYVAQQFDFSACMTWWCSEEERFTSIYPTLTRAKKMFIRRSFISQIDSVRMAERLEKYKSRGFVVVDEPPPFWNSPDERKEEHFVPWRGVSAFDVMAYEDVLATDHLQGGEWNILVGCGDTWYAFERRMLICYMQDRRKKQGDMVLYETPFRQFVGHDGWDSLAYSDDSVYRLVDPVSRGTKTIYTVETYSLQGWQEGVVSQQFPPFIHQEQLGQEGQGEEQGEGQEQEEQNQEQDPEEMELQQLLSEELFVPLVPDVVVPDVPAAVPAVPAVPAVALQNDELYRQILEWIHAMP